jgi:hypothetical protein
MKTKLLVLSLLVSALFAISGCASTGKGTVYTIEAGFFANYKEARTRAAEVKKVTGNAQVDTDIIHYTAVYRVHSGTYDTPQDANGDIARLKKAGIESKAVPKL